MGNLAEKASVEETKDKEMLKENKNIPKETESGNGSNKKNIEELTQVPSVAESIEVDTDDLNKPDMTMNDDNEKTKHEIKNMEIIKSISTENIEGEITNAKTDDLKEPSFDVENK